MGTYVYGVMRWPQAQRIPRSLRQAGVGDPPAPIELLGHRDLAALVSRISDEHAIERESPRALRRDMKSHAALLNGLIAEHTVLPLRFGTIFPNDETVIAKMLQRRYAQLDALLDQLDGAVELTLRASYRENRVLQEVVAANPRLSARPKSYTARVDLGRRVAQAIQIKQEDDARWLLDVLRPTVRAVRIGKPMRELMLLNASLLVERSALQEFDRRLAQVNQEQGHRISLDCVGPLPPYSFVELEG